MENYKLHTIEEYLNLDSVKDLPEETKDQIRLMRSQSEIMPVEMFTELVRQKIVVRTQKLRKPRSLWVNDDKVWYFNFYKGKYEYCAYFPLEEN